MSERQASTYRTKSFTSAHVHALEILSENHVSYLAEQRVRAYGKFNHNGKPIYYTVDINVDDPNFGSGVVEIDGEVHIKLLREEADKKRDANLKALGLWVEHLTNEQVPEIMVRLEKHKVQIDAYGGRS